MPHRSSAAGAAATADPPAPEDTFIINVGGVKFETTLKTLMSVPGSRLQTLASLKTNHASYRNRLGDYYFDRNSSAFETVLEFHRTGVLHVSGAVCGSLLKHELKFWGIDDSLVEQCCWDHYSQSVDRSKNFDSIEAHFNDDRLDFGDQPVDEASILGRWATKLWLTLSAPRFSRAAKVVFLLSVVFTVASLAIIIAESHCDAEAIEEHSNGSKHANASSYSCSYNGAVGAADVTVFCYFAVELLLRVIVSPKRREFLVSAPNIIDFICVLGQAATIAERYAAVHSADEGLSAIDLGVRWLRILQLLRVYKLLRHNVMSKVLMYTVLMSLHELAIVIVFLASFVVLFACLMHYAEAQTFPTISYACWWAFITLTTVGYGDVYPTTTAGYVVGCLCALCGIFALAFTVPVVVSNFNVYYNHVRLRRRWRDKCKRANFTSSLWRTLPFAARRLESWPDYSGRTS